MANFIRLTQRGTTLPVLFDKNIINAVLGTAFGPSFGKPDVDKTYGARIMYGEENNWVEVNETVDQIQALLDPPPERYRGLNRSYDEMTPRQKALIDDEPGGLMACSPELYEQMRQSNLDAINEQISKDICTPSQAELDVIKAMDERNDEFVDGL